MALTQVVNDITDITDITDVTGHPCRAHALHSLDSANSYLSNCDFNDCLLVDSLTPHSFLLNVDTLVSDRNVHSTASPDMFGPLDALTNLCRFRQAKR